MIIIPKHLTTLISRNFINKGYICLPNMDSSVAKHISKVMANCLLRMNSAIETITGRGTIWGSVHSEKLSNASYWGADCLEIALVPSLLSDSKL